MTEAFDFGNPASPDNSDGGQVYVFGCEWESTTAGTITGGRWRRPTNPPTGNCYMLLYKKTGTELLASKVFTLPTAGDNDVLFDTPVDVEANTRYVSAVLANRYAFTLAGWPFTSGPGGFMTAPNGVNGRLTTTTADTPAYPGTVHGSAANFFIGPLGEFVEPSIVALTPATLTLSAIGVTATPGVVTVSLTPATLSLAGQAVTATPGLVTTALTAAALTLEAQPLTPTPGVVTVALTPATMTLIALQLFSISTGFPHTANRLPFVAESTRTSFTMTGGG